MHNVKTFIFALVGLVLASLLVLAIKIGYLDRVDQQPAWLMDSTSLSNKALWQEYLSHDVDVFAISSNQVQLVLESVSPANVEAIYHQLQGLALVEVSSFQVGRNNQQTADPTLYIRAMVSVIE